MRRIWLALVLVVAVGCGRIDFDPASGDSSSARANRVFVTSTTFDGTLASPALATADAMCMARAMAGGISGRFVAWLSTSSQNAIDRLAGSRGWVRVDGVPVLDQPSDLLLDRFLNPIDVDESGTVVPSATSVWTGTAPDGMFAQACADWSDATMTASYGGAGNAPPSFTSIGTGTCNSNRALYCFEIGNVVPVAPASTAGRIVFLSSPRTAAQTSQAGLDQLCQTDANTAGLPAGTYLAAVATTTASIQSRFTIDAMPWRRVDGSVVASTAGTLFDGSQLASFVTQTADGTYDLSSGTFYSGANSATAVASGNNCTDWSSLSAGSAAIIGESHYTGNSFWSYQMDPCDAGDRVLCLQH